MDENRIEPVPTQPANLESLLDELSELGWRIEQADSQRLDDGRKDETEATLFVHGR